MLIESQIGLSLIFSMSLSLPLNFVSESKQAITEPIRVEGTVLESLISDVLASHPSQASQALLLLSAQAGVESAKWQFYPTPSFSVEKASAGAADSAYAGDSAVATLRIQQPLWTGGRLTAGVKKAQANVEVSQATFEETRQQLAIKVIQNYGEWLGAHLKIKANERSMETHIRLRAQIKRRIEQGVAPESEYTQAVVRLEALASDIAVSKAQQDIALSRLSQLLGRPLDAERITSNITPPKPVTKELLALVDQAKTIYPGIKKAHALASMQESLVEEKKSELYPEVYLRAEQQYGNFTYKNAPSERRIFVGLTSRFGPGLSSKSNMESAVAQHQAALEEVGVQERAATEFIQTDYALALSLRQRLTSLKSSLNAAQDISASYDRQFLAGKKTWLDVMNAARELAQTENQLADIESTNVVTTWRLSILTSGLKALTNFAQ